MRVLVTGGAGYIGSVIAARLLAAGHAVTVFDDLSRGHQAAVPAAADFVPGDVRDGAALGAALAGCEAVVHMAALAEVAESVAHPDRYHDVNVHGSRTLVAAALAAGVARLVFSSTAAVYGEPGRMPIDEDVSLAPTNPYGDSKLAAERALFESAEASRGVLSVCALRYFNAAGADGPRGEDHEPESHLIPLALRAVRDGRELKVYGDDYPTADGTCVRDYVHVLDLADAHVAALERLPAAAGACNLGSGHGSSVRDVLRAVAEATARNVPHVIAARRPGDPPALVAAHARATAVLDWTPRRSLDEIVADAWSWFCEHPAGYSDRERRDAGENAV